MDMLERVKKVSTEWVRPGHQKGQNTHNVSATVSIREEEWDEVGQWMWDNRDVYNGLSVLPTTVELISKHLSRTVTRKLIINCSPP